MTESTLRDEIDGAIQKLCSISCENERQITVARDTLKRISTRAREGVEYADYEPLVERIVTRLMSERKGDDWFMKHRILETIPTFVMKGETYAIVACASFLKNENWMMRQAATEAIGHLMDRRDIALPKCASRPGTRTNSRPPSPGIKILRKANSPAKPRLEKGEVIDNHYGVFSLPQVRAVFLAVSCGVHSLCQ